MKPKHFLKTISNVLKPETPAKPEAPRAFDWESLPPQVRRRAESLRKWRRERSVSQSVPSYVILHNATLVKLATDPPLTLDQLSEVRGIGPHKLKNLGQEILTVLKAS